MKLEELTFPTNQERKLCDTRGGRSGLLAANKLMS